MSGASDGCSTMMKKFRRIFMLIEEMNFSVRTYNCLKRKKIDTVEQLKGMSDDELLRIRNFGVGCLKEVREKIHVKPIIPGPEEADPNFMELCFRNGEAHMKEKTISLLMEYKTKAEGICHAHITEIIRRVQSL